ncbi:endonuclease MutS2 [Sulfurospirillum sp. 1612]|uniref:endonuclease MutS2 n=1 Tax=Sulfurospirillum sp. 1612 TaxID=3094835 RepID=UPI002F92D989
MNALSSKLDLEEYLHVLSGYFARKKPLFIEGDSKIHYKFIKELMHITDIKASPEVANLDVPLAHLSKQGVLKIYEIYTFVQIINYFTYLKKILVEDRLGEWMRKIEIPDEIAEICQYFNEKGELKSTIDDTFLSIEQALSRIKEETAQALRRIMSNTKLSLYLVDRQVHYINNQEALLLRGGFNHVIKGSVLGRSSSGFFYIFPDAIASLKSKESALIDRKEELIYTYTKKISTIFSKYVKFLSFVNREFDRFDAYYARVMLAKEKDLEFVLAKKTNTITLHKFSHPALKDPKPISIDFSKHVLMITGVNAGGKTMFLKSILSAAFLSKYLLPMKIDANHSEIGAFKEINAILDDPQNVKNDISTFAGRMGEFSKLFSKKDTLVGIDEIELGTDADEAASLFKVIIENLIKKDIKIIITTHHKRLASLLATHESVQLLAAIYDEKNQRPTYEFINGTIGKSYAFETALRYKIPPAIIQEARTIYGEDKEKLNELIQKNIDLELQMRAQSRELDEKLKDVQKLKSALQDEKERSQREFENSTLKMQKSFNKAIQEAKEAIKSKDVKEGHRFLNKAHEFKKAAKNVTLSQKSEDLKIGDRVKYGNSKGVIQSIKKDIAMIDCDGITMRVPLVSLRRSGNPPTKPSRVMITKPRSNSGVTLDLHGLRADEAIEKLDKFLSDALINGFDEVLVYHGIGTGKLAYAVKNFLSTYPSLVSFGDAPAKMGGYGATLIRL